ncbi:MAG: 4-hydroxy-tetrahydrodipicolinate reductase [Treponema sp.]|nr:4-hydroxy-tetrahydrodipicolinate reductase [Treponema sp.]
MKVILVGYGKMGRLLEAQFGAKGHQVLAVVEPSPPPAKTTPGGALVYASLGDALGGPAGKSLKDADAAIEFTGPDCAPGNLLFLAKENIPAVTGTTGWYDRLPEVSRAVRDAGAALLWSSNFSLGVNLFFRIAAHAAKLIDPFAEYDVAGFESHHNKKADSPSGTAKTLAGHVLAGMTRKKKAVYEMLDRPPGADELHYASVRVGAVPGTHSLFFDSPADTIELTHTARSREGFAAGAVVAALWLTAKKRAGVFTMDDALQEILP